MKYAPLPLWVLLTISASTPGTHADVKTVRVPHGGEVPEVFLDAKGVLHMAYGRGLPGNGYYVQSRDGGKTFTKPVQVNRHPDTVTTGRERGPKLAVGKDGVVHVVWLGEYKETGGVWYTRSTDGGKTFEAERNLVRPKYGVDNATVAADADGHVFALWTGGFPGVKEDPESPVASPIVLVRSTDNGKTFSKNELLHSDHPASGRACGCCRLEARAGTDGNLYVAFRAGYKGIRDPYLLRGRASENDFKSVRVSVDKWKAD
ncbi:MAG TPA: sialidase family protein [Gemmataceae bacterium]|nr:sialidase family protein [Gemmataceae bacterium]